ncbi:hypothetical protein LCGC14_2804890, partial [marine sediment metagenome]
ELAVPPIGIQAVKSRAREAEWSPQAKYDEDVLDLALRMEEQSMSGQGAMRAGKTAPKSMRAGFAGFAMDRNAAVMSGTTFMGMAARSKDKKDIEHANQKLEPWIAGVMRRSQLEDVLEPQIRHLWLFSRGISNFFPTPDLWWGGTEIKRLMRELQELAKQNTKKAEAGQTDKKLRAEIKEVREKIASHKERQFPLRWTICEPRSTWKQRSKSRYLPEVVEIARMTWSELASEYGEKEIPKGYADLQHSTSKITVYRHHNWVYSTTVIPFYEDDVLKDVKMPHQWDHDLGMNPTVWMEVGIQPENDLNLYYKSILYDFKDSLEAMNEILGELRHIHRTEARTGLVITLNPERRGRGDAAASGDPTKIPIKNKDGNIILWDGEKVVAGPTVTINPASIEFLKWLTDFVYQ